MLESTVIFVITIINFTVIIIINLSYEITVIIMKIIIITDTVSNIVFMINGYVRLSINIQHPASSDSANS